MIKGLLAAGAAAAAVAMISAPAAGAVINGEANYLQHLASAEIIGDSNGLVADGWAISNALANGADPNELSATYYTNSGSISHDQADAAVGYAFMDLCPPG